MSAGFLQKGYIRHRRRRWCRSSGRLRRCFWLYYPFFLMIVVSLLFSGAVIGTFENRLRPVLVTAAQMQTRNAVISIAEDAILSELDRLGFEYADLVRVERGADGGITAITTDMAAMNRLRSTVLEAVLKRVSEIDEKAISIPLGSLIDSELVWGRGPDVRIKSFTIGTVSAEFRSDFTSAGVNQTLHKIWLDLSIPTTVLLPGTRLDVGVDTMLCVAETVIVGNVPSYIQRAAG